MKNKDVSRLLQRYLSAREMEKDPYFDADEIDYLLTSFEESDDFTYYDELLALGLKLHPGNPDLQIKYCKQLVFTGKYKQALALLDNLTGADKQDLDLLRLECFCSLNEYGKVVEYLETLILEECDYLEIVFEYITPILNDLEMYKEGRDFIDRGLLLFPENQILKDELCFILETEGDTMEAIRVCNELIDKNPYSYDYWFTLGRLYSIIAEYEKAVEAFDFALTCDDSNEELKILKAYCLYMNESYQMAIEVYKEFSSEPEIWERVQPLVAECYMKLEEYEEAYQILKKIVDTDTLLNSSVVYINYLYCCMETDREKEASQILHKAADLFPDNIRVLSILALSYLEKGEEEKAKEIANQLLNALELLEDDAESNASKLLQAGKNMLEIGEVNKAISYFKKAEELNPDMPQLNIFFSIAYFTKKNLTLFEQYYSMLTPEEIDIFLNETMQTLEKDENNPFFLDQEKQIPPEKLSTEFLKNKENNN